MKDWYIKQVRKVAKQVKEVVESDPYEYATKAGQPETKHAHAVKLGGLEAHVEHLIWYMEQAGLVDD